MRYGGAKGRAWEAVRRYCRRKSNDCYTCEAKNLVSYNAQAGHAFPVGFVGSNNRLSWDERQLNLQCGRCNGAGQGMQVEYRAHLVRDYGEAAVREMEARRYKVDPIKNWEEIIAHFDSLTPQ